MKEISIGEFARRSRLSLKALRLYDERGVLVPSRVDQTSGYRYYDPAQLEQARLVVMLRQLQMPLTAIKELLARKPVSFPVLLDPANQVSKAYHVDEMPSSVIIDRKGEIRYIHRGYRPGDENEYQDRIRQLIRE